MTLNEFILKLAAEGGVTFHKSCKKFAVNCDCSWQAINSAAKGYRRPSLQLTAEIIRQSCYTVELESLRPDINALLKKLERQEK